MLYYLKVGCKGVLITRTCYPDGILNIASMTITGSNVLYLVAYSVILIIIIRIDVIITQCMIKA